MCNMDNDSNNNKNNENNEYDFMEFKDNRNIGKYGNKNNGKMDLIISYILIHDKEANSYKYLDEADTDLYYVNLRRKSIIRCSKVFLKDKYRKNNKFMKTIQLRDILIVIDKSDWFKPQAFPHLEQLFGMLYDKGKDISNKIINIFSVFKEYSSKLSSSFKVFGRIDWGRLCDLIISIFFSASTALVGIYGVLQFLYNLFKFVAFINDTMKEDDREVMRETNFEPQSMSLEALMAGFTLMGIPSWLLEKIKNFALLTGVKVHASHSFSSLFSKIKDIILSVVSYIFSFACFAKFSSVIEPFVSVVEYLFAPFSFYDDILQVSDQYTQFVKDNSVLHNPVFRDEVKKLYDRLKVDNGFLDYIRNNDNRHFGVTWGAYRDNLIKFVDTYSTSARDEPICIVFDGPPGSGKSVLMNRFVELLKAHNKSVYTHTVPPLEASKDFYDDYMNQNVFVMDDVGQQGKSQWRTIINFVAPVKYPLDCAQAEKKNTKFFQSEVILCTTNNFKHLSGFTSKDGISCPGALFRRVHLISVERNYSTTYFKQRLSYSKYEEANGTWCENFLGPNRMVTKYSSSGNSTGIRDFPYVIDTPQEDGLKASLRWLFLLYNHLTESNKIDRSMTTGLYDHSAIIADILSSPSQMVGTVKQYKPQFFEMIYDTLNDSWNGVSNGANIFREYVNYLTSNTEKFFKKIISSLVTKIISPLWDLLVDKCEMVSGELQLLLRGIYRFLVNLVSGDFVEKREYPLMQDHCYVCMEKYGDIGNVDNFGRPTDIPIAVLPCGHTMCAQCAVMQRVVLNQSHQHDRTCGICRAPSYDCEEFLAYYVGNQKVSYDVVRNYIKEGRACIANKVYSAIDCLADAIIGAIDFMGPELFECLLFILSQVFIFVYLRILIGAHKPQAKGAGILSWLFGGKSSNEVTFTQFEESRKRAEELMSGLKFNMTSAEGFKKNHCRIMINTKTGVHSCIIVSGRRFLTNSHIDPNDIVVDVYQSFNHFKEGHKEMESVRVKIIKNYMASDVCVCEFIDIIPFYKVFNRFGGTDVNKFSPNMFVSPYGIVPLVPGVNVGKNTDKVTYKYKIRGDLKIIEHPEMTGLQYGVQGAGLCGSVVYDEDRVVGIHVTGNGKEGFAQIFPSWLCSELNVEMFNCPMKSSFEVREDIIPNFSGVRLKYGAEDKWANFGAANIKTSYLPSDMHISLNKNTQQMYTTIKELQECDDIAPTELELKQPPVFGDSRSKVKENMVKISRKSFKHQGYISDEEMGFVKECIRSILPEKINDLTDEETSFGGLNVKGFKKDTSNGFACLKGKDSYLDFDNKRLTKEGRAILDRFKSNAREQIFDEDDFVCKETFKDELRTENKINKPRVFRVMPFPHIWWSKKLLGELIPWFKKNLHEFGVCIGFNPYTDFDKLVRKLQGETIHGDEDYSEWDGSLLALVLLAIRDEFKRVYVGENGDVLDYLMVTIARSWTMVTDELYATTHSLPSGTWMTLLMNCLVNKALVALTVYRNKNNATVLDFHKVINYVCGDDKIFGSKEETNYNLLTVKKTVESLGMTVTNGDKSPVIEPSRDLMKLNFLKRNILFHPILKRYVGALSISTLFNTLQWYSADKVGESLTYDDLMRDKCNAVLVESYLHSRNCFLIFKDYMMRCGVVNLFDETKVVRILQDEDGHEIVLDLLKKNYLN